MQHCPVRKVSITVRAGVLSGGKFGLELGSVLEAGAVVVVVGMKAFLCSWSWFCICVCAEVKPEAAWCSMNARCSGGA